jgi:radical SAM superfamily enzyme YgiQ (UPF0313 family)
MRITLPLLAALMPPEVDATIAYDQCRDLERDLDFGAYDLVGLTCTTHTGQIARAAELADLSRRRGTPCIVGGPVTVPQNHHFVPLLAEHFDSVIVGEAEPVLFDVLSDVQNHRLRPTYESVGFQPFENVPIPRFDLIDLNNFSPPYVFPVQTARGCPHHCAFCSEFLYTPWRFRPVPEVIAELLRYKSEFGADRLIFRDDDFLVHPKRSHELLTQLQTLDLEWACQTDLRLSRRLDLANLAVDAGLRAVAFGLEPRLRPTRRVRAGPLRDPQPRAATRIGAARNLGRFTLTRGHSTGGPGAGNSPASGSRVSNPAFRGVGSTPRSNTP